MNFFNLFKIKDSSTNLFSDSQFIAMEKGTIIQKTTGEEYIKTDTNVFDKTSKTVRTDTENDLRYPQLNGANTFNYPNNFTKGITVSGNIKSDNIQNSDDITTKNLTASDHIKGGTLEVTGDSALNDVTCGNLTASDHIKGASLEVTGDSNLVNINVSGYVRAEGTVASNTLLQAPRLSVTNEANLENIKSKTIVNSTTLKTDSLTVTNGSTLDTVNMVNGTVSNNLTVSRTTTTNALTSTTISNSGKITTSDFESTTGKFNGNLTVNGTSTLKAVTATAITDSGDLTVNGNTSLKNVTSTNITNSSLIKTANSETSGTAKALNVTPFTNDTGTIGTSALYYKTAYITTIYGTDYKGKAYKAGYADLAEVYTTDKPYEAGTVLQVCTSSNVQGEEYFGGALLGVVSTNPGIVLNEESEGCVVALKGMIPVKCEGDIEKGQYCIAHNGKVVGMFRHQMTIDNLLRLVGVALEDSKDGMVLVKV